MRSYPADGLDKIRIQYRYGESSVPGEIEDACTKLVAAELCMQDDRKMFLPDGTTINTSNREKAERWKSQAESIISGKRGMRLVF